MQTICSFHLSMLKKCPDPVNWMIEWSQWNSSKHWERLTHSILTHRCVDVEEEEEQDICNSMMKNCMGRGELYLGIFGKAKQTRPIFQDLVRCWSRMHHTRNSDCGLRRTQKLDQRWQRSDQILCPTLYDFTETVRSYWLINKKLM